jgi:hypothetical protein
MSIEPNKAFQRWLTGLETLAPHPPFPALRAIHSPR